MNISNHTHTPTHHCKANQSHKQDQMIIHGNVIALKLFYLFFFLYRHSKPFNPLLGETYELVRKDLGYCLIAEQVHHLILRTTISLFYN